MKKLADLLPNVKLQPHQQQLEEEAEKEPVRKLLYWQLGSGKSLGAIGAAEARKEPYSIIAPASLRQNFRGEISKFTDKKMPSDVISYSQLAQGTKPEHTGTLVFDESHRLRNPGTKQTREAVSAAGKAKQLLLLSGSPVVNDPQDLAVQVGMLKNKKIDPVQFRNRFVGEKKVYPNILKRILGITPGTESVVKHPEELKALLKGHIDYYAPESPVVPTNYRDVNVEMGKEQSQLYQAMWDKLPWYLRWKLKWDFPLSRDELRKATSFLTGPRQVGLSTYPYMRRKDPHAAYQQSPKLQKAMELLQEKLKDPRTKALVFSNFIDAGLTPYAAALQKANIPHGVFHGGLSDAERKKLVEDYNANKLRVALMGPSGTEGLSFKGTQLVQMLDPYWNPIRGKQSVGRGLRYDSHLDLPEDIKNVEVQRFVARLPLGLKDRILSRLGFDRSHSQLAADDYLRHLAGHKEELNQKFLDLLKEVGTKQAAEYAPGIPFKNDYGDLDKIKANKLYDWVVHKHDAHRAGTHHDLRFGNRNTGLYSWALRKGLPSPGGKHLAIQQPLHSHSYKDFEGDIKTGYGAGKVSKAREGQVLVTRVEPTGIHFTTATGRYPERYALIKPKIGKNWLLLNTTKTEAIPYEKVHYKTIPADKAEKVLSKLEPGSSVQAKIDGAASLTKLYKDHAEVVSYRAAKRTGYPLVHTERVFRGRPKFDIPREMAGSVLRGELYGQNQVGKSIRPQALGGLLNSGIAKSLQDQKAKGVDLKNLLFDIQQYGSKSVSHLPYSRRMEQLREVAKHLPSGHFTLPEEAKAPEEALALWKKVTTGKHPLTHEGVVIHPLHGKPSKIKQMEEHDVHIREMFPGMGKYKGIGIGGFRYSHTPKGPILGEVGTGLSDELRKEMYKDPQAFIGRIAKVHAQEKYPSGALRAPALLSLHEDKPEAKVAKHSVLKQLLQAKSESDVSRYKAKHSIMRKLLHERPEEFKIDSGNDGIVGLTHAPTGFRMHLPKRVIPTKFIEHSKDLN